MADTPEHVDLFDQIVAGFHDADAADDGERDPLLSTSTPREVALSLIGAWVHDDADGFNTLVSEMDGAAATHTAVMLAMANLGSAMVLSGDLDEVPEKVMHARMSSQSRDPLASAAASQLIEAMVTGHDPIAAAVMSRVVAAWGLQADADNDLVVVDGYEMLLALASQAEYVLGVTAMQANMEPAVLLSQIAMEEASRR